MQDQGQRSEKPTKRRLDKARTEGRFPVSREFISMGAQLGTTQLGFAVQKLTPEFGRLNPFQKLRDLPQQGFSALSQALLLIPIFGFAIYRIVSDNLGAFLSLPLLSLEPALNVI